MHIRCGSTAYCYLPRKRPDTYRHKKTLGRAPVSPDIAGPCPAEPFQLVPTQLGLISAGIDQLRACESPPKRGLLAAKQFRRASVECHGTARMRLFCNDYGAIRRDLGDGVAEVGPAAE